MMKKKNLLIVCFLFVLSFVFSESVSAPYSHYMVGYVSSKTDFSVNLFEEAIPFDLDGAEVAYNSSRSTISGLRVGEYTLISNSGVFALYIAHTPLVLRGSDGSYDETELKFRKIGYRLDVIVDYNGVSFYSCLNDEVVSDVKNAEHGVSITNTKLDINADQIFSLVKKSLYVSLDNEGVSETTPLDTVLRELQSGMYESYIYFMLEGV